MSIKTYLTGLAAAVMLSACTTPATQEPPTLTQKTTCEISRNAGYGHCGSNKAEALISCRLSSEACTYFAQQNYELCVDTVQRTYELCVKE